MQHLPHKTNSVYNDLMKLCAIKRNEEPKNTNRKENWNIFQRNKEKHNMCPINEFIDEKFPLLSSTMKDAIE